ncbi:MAG: hypothetical protein ABIW85_05635 [Variovorax sp.]
MSCIFGKATTMRGAKGLMNNRISKEEACIEWGKYRVAPLCKELDDGRYAASVSIRSGRGSHMHDRVMRFTPLFASSAAAFRYASEQGIEWVRERVRQPPLAPLAGCRNFA